MIASRQHSEKAFSFEESRSADKKGYTFFRGIPSTPFFSLKSPVFQHFFVHINGRENGFRAKNSLDALKRSAHEFEIRRSGAVRPVNYAKFSRAQRHNFLNDLSPW